jgi:3-isopropylmalate dehydrogenase
MTNFKILVLPGDGVGPEIIAEAVKTLRSIEKVTDIKFDYNYAIIGGCSIDRHGVPITQEVVEQAKACDAVLFGSVGGPKW